MNQKMHTIEPVFKGDEDQAIENADGTIRIPTSVAFFANRAHSAYAPTKDEMKGTYGSVRESVFDANGYRMGLLTAPGLDPRKEIAELIELFRRDEDASVVRGLTQWMQRGAAPAP